MGLAVLAGVVLGAVAVVGAGSLVEFVGRKLAELPIEDDSRPEKG